MEREVSTSMPIPLDSDGFLRRECPTCEREFKWFASPADGEDESAPIPDGGYYCPYCAIQASPDAWFTKAQLEHANSVIARELVEPELNRFRRQIERGSGGIKVSVDIDAREEPPPLTETDDMRRVDFPCHPTEPVKVSDDWSLAVHCLICGEEIEPESTVDSAAAG